MPKAFSNRFPQTKTNGIALRHRVFQPVPYASIGTGTTEAAMLTQGGSPFGTGWYFQPVPMTFSFFFPNQVLFVIFITIYSFIIAKRTQALQYYTFIGRSCSF